MGTPKRATNPMFVAQVVADAAAIGKEAAAKRHGVSTRTIHRYRALVARTPELAAKVDAKKEAVGHVLDALLLEAQKKLVARVVALAEKEPDLYKVSGALKIVSDARGGDQVRELLLGAKDGAADGQRDAGAAAGGAGTTPGEAASRAAARLSH